jgi:hypothetical protein
MIKDPFEIVLDTVKTLKDEISDLYDKYNDMNRLVWMKLTEIETILKAQKTQQDANRTHWHWVVPVAISLLALLVAIFEIFRK